MTALDKLKIRLPAEEKERALQDITQKYVAGHLGVDALERAERRHGVNYRAAAVSLAGRLSRSHILRVLAHLHLLP